MKRNLKGLLALALAVCGVLAVSGVRAQTSATAPAATQQEVKAPLGPVQADAKPVDDYKKKHDAQLLRDFGWLEHFREADLALVAPAVDEDRVAFMGDSITEGWHFTGANGWFNGKPYINRGIGGQTTPQMLVRFRQDVIALQPKVVVILAGTNDIAGNTGSMTIEQTEGNLASMAELAAANHIRVVLCSLLPAYDYWWKPGMEPAAKIVKLNAWIKSYAAQKGIPFVDFHTAMKDSRDGLPVSLSKDGVHPEPAGYAVMTPLVEAGIAKSLAKSLAK